MEVVQSFFYKWVWPVYLISGCGSQRSSVETTLSVARTAGTIVITLICSLFISVLLQVVIVNDRLLADSSMV